MSIQKPTTTCHTTTKTSDKQPSSVKRELKADAADSESNDGGSDADSSARDAPTSDWATQLAAKLHDPQTPQSEKREPKQESDDNSQSSKPQPRGSLQERAQQLLQRLTAGSLSDKDYCVACVETARTLAYAIGCNKSGEGDASEFVQTAAEALSRLSKRLKRIRLTIFDVNGITKLSKTISEACAARPTLQSRFDRLVACALLFGRASCSI